MDTDGYKWHSPRTRNNRDVPGETGEGSRQLQVVILQEDFRFTALLLIDSDKGRVVTRTSVYARALVGPGWII